MKNISVVLSLFLTNALCLYPTTADNDNVLLYSLCSNVTTTNIKYISDLQGLLSYMATDVPILGYSYRGNDVFTGIFLCSDTFSRCDVCLNQSYGYITNRSYPIEAVIWYDLCILQYSQLEFFDNNRQFLMGNTRNLTGPMFSGWDQSNNSMKLFIYSTLHELLTNVSEYAALYSQNLFATGMTNNTVTLESREGNKTVSLPVKIYALSQCFHASPASCRACLQNLTNLLLESYDGSQGGRIVGLWCNLRFETYAFFSYYPDVIISYVPSTEILPFPPSGQPPASLPESHPQLYSPPGSSKGRRSRLLVIVVSVTFVLLILGCVIGILWIRKLRSAEISQEEKTLTTSDEILDLWDAEGNSDVPLFHFKQIVNATSNFSLDNKLGQGGFGPVYKGVLQDGLEIAIKRLSAHSGQGLTEFRNEIQLIGKLQHRNLVRLVGWCVHGHEKLLVYEFMPNKSLDFFIFDETRAALLDWERRFEIIEGIAQGLVYLHKHSRLRIVHRDLKASNVLLDSEMNPKISDFGLARIFGPKELEANTNRVVGTYGYMAPEYASEGLFSVKSDVFSYGVLMLEIASGKRSMGFHQYGDFLNLLGYAWDRWKEGRFFELICTILTEVSQTQIERCIHVALLCVQENPGDRPTMSDVITFLTTASIVLPEPKQPAYFNVRVTEKAEESSDLDGSSCSVNYVTLTNPEVR